MSNYLCRLPRICMTVACCCAGGSLLAAAVDGVWIQPLNDNYNMSTGQYWLRATVANGGGSATFINQSSDNTKKLTNDKGTLTWNNVDLGASAFTLEGQPVVITGNSILTATSTTGVKFTNDVSFASGATVTKRGAGTVTFCNKVSASSATLTLAEGKLVSLAADAFLTDAALNLRTGLLEWKPSAVADANLSVTTAALAYGPDRAHIKVTKGNAASYAVTFASLARVDGGFLDLQLTGGIDALGEAEKFLVSGRASDCGFIDASVISRGAGATGDAINFLVYDAEKGFIPAVTNAFVEGQAADGTVAVISEDTTVSQDTAVSALLVKNGAELTIASGVTLTVGDGVHPAGVIWHATNLASGAIKYWKGPGTLAFKAGSAGYFYYNGSSTQTSPSWTVVGRLYIQNNLKLTGTAGVTLAGAANAQRDYGTISFQTDAVGWTGGTSILGTRFQCAGGATFRNLPSPVRVLGDASQVFGGQIRQNNETALTQDFTISGPGVQLAPTSHSGFFNWGGSPSVTINGRITLANDAAMNNDNKPSTAADLGSLVAKGGITGPGGITLSGHGYLDLAGPCDYRGATTLSDSRTGLYVTGPDGTPGLGPVVSKASRTPVVTFRKIDELVASNDFTSIGGVLFTAVSNIAFLGAVDFAKAEFCGDMTLGCGTNTVNFGVISQSGINVTAAVDGGALTVGREGTDFPLAARLTDGAHGERLGLVKTTSDTVTLYPGAEAATYSGPTSVREGTLRLVDDPFLSGSIAYWLDADDASTIFTDGEGRVTKWTSKAGVAGLAFVPPTAVANFPYAGPTVSEAAINGRNVLMFAPDAEHFSRLVATNTVTGGGYATVNQRTVFILTRPRKAGVTANNTFIFNGWNTAIGQRCGAGGWDVRGPNDSTGETFDTMHGLRLDGVLRPTAAETWNNLYPYHDASQQILAIQHTFDFVVTNAYGVYNGTSRLVPALGGGARYTDVAYSRGFHGDIAEVIAFNRVLSEAELQRVENYLAEKWGIARPHAEVAALPAAISPATTLSVAQDATFDLHGIDTTVAALEGRGLVTNSSERAATLTVTGRNAFAGRIAGNVTLVDQSTAEASYALRGGASLVVDGGRAALAAHADGPVTNGIAYWVDASKPETVQLDANGRVTNWTCRAGTVASFRCTPRDYWETGSTTKYVYTSPERYDLTAFNGKPAVYFGGKATDGTNHLVSSSTATTRTLFLVCKCDGKVAGQQGFFTGPSENGIMVNNGWDDCFGLRPYTGTTYHKYGFLLHAIGESVAYDYTYEPATVRASVSCFQVPYTFIIAAQCDESSNAFSNYKDKSVWLGRGYHRGVKAWFAEVIGYDRLLSAAEVADVEAYLKNKWFTADPVAEPEPVLAADASVSLKNGGTLDLSGAAATVDSLDVGRAGGSFVGDVTLTGNLTVDFEGAQTMSAPLMVDGDLTVTGARVEFLNFTNVVTDTWHDFLLATGTATGDFASDNLFGAYRRKKAGSSYSLAHLTGVLIIFR